MCKQTLADLVSRFSVVLCEAFPCDVINGPFSGISEPQNVCKEEFTYISNAHNNARKITRYLILPAIKQKKIHSSSSGNQVG